VTQRPRDNPGHVHQSTPNTPGGPTGTASSYLWGRPTPQRTEFRRLGPAGEGGTPPDPLAALLAEAIRRLPGAERAKLVALIMGHVDSGAVEGG